MDKQTQQELLLKIKQLTVEYNKNAILIDPSHDRRLIVDSHWVGCRCVTCWYDYDAKNYAHLKGHSEGTDKFNS